MAYTKAQFVSYQINTFPKIDGTDAFGKRYLGHAKAETDIHYRCNLMRNAIDKGAASVAISGSSQTLKIFMAPEFYFRGKEGAYPIELVSSIMSALRQHTRAARFKDWIFVFGTALGYLEDDGTKEIFNVALVQRGGTEASDVQNALIVYKELISHIDFIREDLGHLCPSCNTFIPNDWYQHTHRPALVGPSTGNVINDMTVIRPTQGSRDLLSKRVEATGTGRESTKSGLGGQGIFTMAGVTFALEICRDHLQGRLRLSPPEKGSPLPQIHLITSAGAWIEEAHVACLKGGLIFNVDGNSRTAVNRNIGDYQHPKMQYASQPNGIVLKDTIPLDLTGVASRWGDYFNEEGYVFVYAEEGFAQSKTMT